MLQSSALAPCVTSAASWNMRRVCFGGGKELHVTPTAICVEPVDATGWVTDVIRQHLPVGSCRSDQLCDDLLAVRASGERFAHNSV